MPIIVNDNGDISFFASIKDAELYLEVDDVYENTYEVFDRNGNVLKLDILQNKSTFLFFPFIREHVQISPRVPNVNKKDYLLGLLENFCKGSNIVIPEKISLNDLIAKLINEIGFSK